MLFLPKWMYFNIYAMSAWTRTIIVPLSLFYAPKPIRPIAPEQADTGDCAGARGRGAVHRSAAQAALAAPADQPPVDVDQLFPRRRSDDQMARSLGPAVRPQEGDRQGDRLDAGAFHRLGRRRRHLSADHLHDHQPDLSRLRHRFAGNAVRPTAA